MFRMAALLQNVRVILAKRMYNRQLFIRAVAIDKKNVHFVQLTFFGFSHSFPSIRLSTVFAELTNFLKKL